MKILMLETVEDASRFTHGRERAMALKPAGHALRVEEVRENKAPVVYRVDRFVEGVRYVVPKSQGDKLVGAGFAREV